MVGRLEREVDRLLGEQDGLAVFVQARRRLSYMASTMAGARPEARLVEQQQLGLAHQRAADRQHLALAARHGAGALAAPLGEPRKHRIDALEQARDARAVGRAAWRPAAGCSRRSAG